MGSLHFNFQNSNGDVICPSHPSPHVFICCVCGITGEAPLFHQYVGWVQARWILCKECAANGKHCSRCGIYQPFSAFVKATRSSNRGGVCGYCRECKRVVNRANYQKNGKTRYALEKERQAKFQKYGITEEIYQQMLEKQGGVCAVCGLPETRKNRKGEFYALAIDHNHQTGQVRALLCTACNVSFGLLKEDSERIKALLAYSQEQ